MKEELTTIQMIIATIFAVILTALTIHIVYLTVTFF